MTMEPSARKAITVQRLHPTAPAGNELTISDIFLVLRRRMNLIGIITGTCFLLGVLVCLFTTRRYEGRAVLEVQKTSADMLGLQNIMAGASDGPGDALNANLDLQTEVEILKSDELALKVIEDLHLDQTRDFQPHWSPVGFVMGLFAPSSQPDVAEASLEDSPIRRTRALMVFASHLKVEAVPGTRLIEIRYFHPDRKVAPEVVNDLVHALKDHGFQTRYAATRESSEWLNGQLADLKQQTQELQAKVVKLQKDSGVYSLGTDSQGRDQTYSSTLDRLQQATTALMGATSNRIMKGAVYQTAKNGDPELISALAGGNLMGSSAGVQNSFTLLQTLRSQQAVLQAQVAQDSSKFGSEYPKLADERSSLQSVSKAISDEVKRIGERAANDYRASQEAEDRLRAEYRASKAEAERLNDKTIEYGVAKQEADDSRGLYEDLFKRLKEAGVIEGFHSSNISVVQPGRVPAKPAKPNVPIYLGVSLLGGLFLGVCGALFTDSVDTKIQSIEGMELLLESPLLAILPEFEKSGRKWLPNRIAASSDQSPNLLESPATPFAESLRGLRTKLLHSQNAHPPKVILVTSSVPGEGKSTVSTNLAALLARSGKRVLLVEADMRNPASSSKEISSLIDEQQLDRLLAIPPRPLRGQTAANMIEHAAEQETSDEGGLKEYLKDFSTELSVLLTDREEKLQSMTLKSIYGMEIMQAGPTPRYPAELLDSDRMRGLLEEWRKEFDYVVLDSPPLLAVTDAAVLSHMADITLLIARPGFTSSKGLKRALDLIETSKETRVGVVLNAVDRKSASYSDYYGHSSASLVVQGKERLHV
jgi:succinoglycan biosynthesis transport protein ExoP